MLSDFSEILKERMQETGYSAESLSRELGIHLNTLYKYLEGRCCPGIGTAAKLADILACSVQYLLGRTETVCAGIYRPRPAFSAWFPLLLKNLGANKYQVCRDAGIAHSSIYSWQSGKTEPTLDNVIRIADHYGVTADFVIGREQ